MNIPLPRPTMLSRVALIGCLATSLLATVPAWAAPKGEGSSAAARLQREVATCNSGLSQQPRDVCLREAYAAFGEARRGGLDTAEAALERNRRQRCAMLPDAERDDCLVRMDGEGTVSGSVASGGVLRELRTIEPAPAKNAAPR